MPRFYFHLRNAGRTSPDELGSDFPDLEAAYLEAFEAARAIWSEMLLSREDPTRCAFVITQHPDSEPLLEVPFSEILDASKGHARPPRALRARAKENAEAMMQRVRALETEIETARERVREACELNARLAGLSGPRPPNAAMPVQPSDKDDAP
jgi:hypothetical protein